MFALAVATALVVLQSFAVGVSADSDPPPLEIDITQCSPGEACNEQSAQAPERTQTTTVVVQQPRARKPPAPAASEVHELDLATGAETVSRQGETTHGHAKVDLDAVRDEPRDHDGPDAGDAPGTNQTLPPVHTNAPNSPFSGFGAGFDFVSGDEALQRFAVPPFLVPIYVSAARAYGVPWNVLAAINQIETDFGRIGHQVSSAGALGWMQFMPGTWQRYGVDASGDGVADPFNPVDAIYAAARYLKASGADADLRGAVLAYNHADWYADSVLRTANVYGSLPAGLVAETGSLAFGRFPVRGPVSYGDDFRRAEAAGKKPGGLAIRGEPGATAIATQNVTVETVLLDWRLARAFEPPAPAPVPAAGPPPGHETAPEPAASSPLPLVQLGLIAQAVTRRPLALPAARLAAAVTQPAPAPAPKAASAGADQRTAEMPDGYGRTRGDGIVVIARDELGNRYRYAGLSRLEPDVRPGAHLRGGQALGELSGSGNPALVFSVRAASGAPVDPRPLVDGYRLQEAADFYHVTAALGGNPFVPDATTLATHGAAIVADSSAALAQRVLSDPGIEIYPCGRADVEHGVVDKRVLGALLYLRQAGLTLTITSLRCGHGYYTAGGNVSAHSYGAAVDIAAFDGQPVFGHQGPGSLTEQAIKLLMQLDGPARPSQLISLMNLGGPSFAMADHDDHLHVGYAFQPALGLGRSGVALGGVRFQGGGLGSLGTAKVGKGVETKLSRKLGGIRNPAVSRTRGAGSVDVETEDARDGARARQRPPFTLEPTAAGARLVDVDVPSGARGDEAYAVGIVDAGAGRSARQVVLLAHRRGFWRVLGAPRDAHGRVANPRLRRLATVHGGAGYAVGERGTIVALRPGRGPRIVASGARTSLRAVDAVVRGGRLTGYAAGTRGVGFALAGSRVQRERLPSGLEPRALAVGTDGTTLGVGRVPGAAIYVRDGAWHSGAELPLPDSASVTVTDVSRSGSATWIAGGLSDLASGIPGVVPFAARLEGGRWTTFCGAAQALSAVVELGQPSGGGLCDRRITVAPGEYGPATAIAATQKGVVLATAHAIDAYRSREFRPLPVAVGPHDASVLRPGWSSLALAPDGQGWALGANGRMTRITPAGSVAATSPLPLPAGGGDEAHLALAPGARTGLVAAGGRVAELAGGSWRAASGPDVPVRALAWGTDGSAWALEDDTGALLRYRGGRWGMPIARNAHGIMRRALLRSLGARGLTDAGATDTAGGLRALAFSSSGVGWAVGDHGAIARFEKGGWHAERSPARTRLNGVAASRTTAVAVGGHGLLLVRANQGWARPMRAASLVGDRDLSAAGVAADGTLLVAGGGMVVSSSGPVEWQRAPVPALGLRVLRLSGYRDRARRLHVLALVDAGGQRALLDGTRAGWRPLVPSRGTAVDDFVVDFTQRKLWIAGRRDGSVVVTGRTL
jgi:hypothetical protein